MRITGKPLVPVTVLAASLSLAACSVSLGRGAEDSPEQTAAVANADITDPGWLDAIENGDRQTRSGDYWIADSNRTYNLVGELDNLNVTGAGVVVAAETVSYLNVAGSDVTVYVREVASVKALGSNVRIYYLDGNPEVQDLGSGNVIDRLTN
ncbi:DUF3060 domain-containing protein [Actinomyces qiguomingii]|uniref:DUF3060 domain-containing protein n=1 Tax=Actinomyces qiguomingii TaxID=2057800 RepID=UPI000CA009D1|nr:DUF3060 domain-containing protein [Actinomyces qiguomingii]